MRLDNERNRILMFIIALAILISTIIMANKNKDNAHEVEEIPEDIIDVKEEGPSELSVLLDQYLTIEEKDYIRTNNKIPDNIIENVIDRVNTNNSFELRRSRSIIKDMRD